LSGVGVERREVQWGSGAAECARKREPKEREGGGGGVGGRRRIKKSDRWAPQMLVGVEYEI
jgi:hypothetical protein